MTRYAFSLLVFLMLAQDHGAKCTSLHKKARIVHTVALDHDNQQSLNGFPRNISDIYKGTKESIRRGYFVSCRADTEAACICPFSLSRLPLCARSWQALGSWSIAQKQTDSGSRKQVPASTFEIDGYMYAQRYHCP